MKHIEIKDLLNRDLLVVELPEKYNMDYTYYREDDETEIAFYLGDDCVQLKLFKGSYALLGKVDEIREEDAAVLVEWGDADPSGDRFMIGYRSYFDGYKDDVPQFTSKTAKESLLSLLESEIYWENPYAEPDKCINGIDNPCYEWWHEAQSRTFDKSRTLIFFKN